MGSCPIFESFPIKCCKYNPQIISSYRAENDDNKDKENINIDISKINIINPINNKELNKKNYTIEENEYNSISSKNNHNNSKLKYNRLVNYKRQLSIEEFIKLNNNLNTKIKNTFLSNQQTISSKIKNLMSKQTTSTANSAQKLIFNLPVIHEDETNNKKEILINILKKNIFFRINFNENQLKKLVTLMSIYEINEDCNNIFNKKDIGNSVFIFEKGEIFIFNNNLLDNNNNFSCNNLLINGDYCFGELCLLNEKENVKRTYSINSLSLLKLYILDKEQYYKFLYSEKINVKITDLTIIKNIEILQYINSEEQLYLSKLSFILDENEDNNIFEKETKIEYINILEFLNLNINLTKQDPRNIFLKINIPNFPNKYLILSIHSIIEIFGINYKYVLIFRIFIAKIKEDSTLFNNIINNYFEFILLFSIFKYKYLNKESSLKIRLSSDNNFCILLLQGDIQLYDDKDNITNYKSFNFINTSKIDNKTKLFFSLNSIILYAKYEDFEETINNIKNSFSLIINKIFLSNFLCELNEDEILFFLNKMKINKYRKNDIIINGEKESSHFYLIIEGKVKLKTYNGKTIQKYSDNDCFGEVFLLDNINNYSKDKYIYVSSENLTIAELHKDDFYKLLINPKINNYIKSKMCLEDKSINFCDLYFLENLNETKLGNLYLVHNGIYLYAIKSVCKLIFNELENEKYYIMNKINILKIINHKFIIKMVSKFKNDKWYFFLMEFVNGIKLNDAFQYFIKNKYILIEYLKFYSAIIFLIIDYLHSLKIIHRDIKINNFIIESDGYLKLIDLGSSKKILNGYAKTILGTPHYMAPEIIEGLNYSFSSDFYSIGILLYYLLYNKFPYGNEENDIYKLYQEILNQKDIFLFLDNNNKLNNQLNELISKLLIKDPFLRYSNINDIKSDIFFKGFNWDLLYAKKLKPLFIPNTSKKYNRENILKDYKISFESFIEKEKTLSEERKTSQIIIVNNISEGVGSELSKQIKILYEDF